MALPAKEKEKYTYQDYLSWPEEERWEIIEGQAYSMSPAPSLKHQNIVWNLVAFLDREKSKFFPCRAFVAPTDVVLDEFNVVQPDVFIVCKQEKLKETHVAGAPEVVFEVVSPATELKDRREKRLLYERFKVKEYVILYPEREFAEVYRLQEDHYPAPEIINWDEDLEIKSLQIKIPLWEIFEKEKPSEGSHG